MGSTGKRNPEIERLSRENDVLRRQLAEMRRDPGDMPVTGCGDTSCVVAQPGGMATNGGCRCSPRDLRIALNYWRRVARFREQTIREQRAQASPVVEALSKLTADACKLQVICTVGMVSVIISTESSGGYRVTNKSSTAGQRSVVVPTPHEAASYFATWLREAKEQEKA